ncbi:MAG: hypothetical protein AAB116_02200, partial [Candidatus Poribacteria bacterium]
MKSQMLTLIVFVALSLSLQAMAEETLYLDPSDVTVFMDSYSLTVKINGNKLLSERNQRHNHDELLKTEKSIVSTLARALSEGKKVAIQSGITDFDPRLLDRRIQVSDKPIDSIKAIREELVPLPLNSFRFCSQTSD